MFDPFKITGPTCISFSGGRTSAYMLWRVLKANRHIPERSVVVFANTGKEDDATLNFIEDCARRWGVVIHWIEYADNESGFDVVTYGTASRNGVPFERLLMKRPMLPNPTVRFCTQELKIRPIAKFLMSLRWFDGTRTDLENTSWIGIRADEQRRAAKIECKSRIPLWAAGVTASEVGAFWASQPFDLLLPNHGGKTMHGNCDLCFLKPAAQIASLIAEKPDRAVWWARMEANAEKTASTPIAARFRRDRPSYAAMLQNASQQHDFFGHDEEPIACFCGD